MATAEGSLDEPPAGPPLWRRVVLICAALVILIAARPGYHALKTWRSRQLAARAEQALLARDLTNALRLAQTAYLMRPTEPAAVRAAARVEGSLGHPSALEFWRALIRTGSATTEDRQEYIGFCLGAGALDHARSELQDLIQEAPDDSENLWLLARLSLFQGKGEEALEFAQQASKRSPNDKKYQLFRATLEYNAPDSSVQTGARNAVRNISRDPSSVGLEAATFLAVQPDLTNEEKNELIGLLERHPLSKAAHQLLAVDLGITLHPERKSEFVQTVVEKYGVRPPEDRAVAGSWLNDRKEFKATIALLPLDRILMVRDLVILHLDALAGADRWSDVLAALNRPELPLADAFIEAFRARTSARLNDATASAAGWKRALQSAAGSREELKFLAQYAEKCSEYEVAKRAYRELMATDADSLEVYLAWSRLLEQHGTTEELRDLMTDMAGRWPDELAFQNDLAYLNLLLNRNVTASFRTALRLVEAYPQNLPFRATLALARLRASEQHAALEAFNGQDWDWDKALPGHRAVYVAALAGNGKLDQARSAARMVPAQKIRPEEHELIQGVLRSIP